MLSLENREGSYPVEVRDPGSRMDNRIWIIGALLLLMVGVVSGDTVDLPGGYVLTYNKMSNTDDCFVDCHLIWNFSLNKEYVIESGGWLVKNFKRFEGKHDLIDSGFKIQNFTTYQYENRSDPIYGVVELHDDCPGSPGVDYGFVNATHGWCDNGTYSEHYFDRYLTNDSGVRFYWNTSQVVGYNPATGLRERWIDFNPVGKTIEEDKWYVIDTWGKKRPQLGKTAIWINISIGGIPLNMSWWNGTRLYRHNISCDNMDDQVPCAVNGSDGITQLNGVECGKQEIWTYCSRPSSKGTNISLYFNDCTDYIVVNESGNLPMEVAVGNSSSNNPTDVWDVNYTAVYHTTINSSGGVNVTDSTKNGHDGRAAGGGSADLTIPANETDCLFGSCAQFENVGAFDTNIYSTQLPGDSNFTVEFFLYEDSWSQYDFPFGWESGTDGIALGWYGAADFQWRFQGAAKFTSAEPIAQRWVHVGCTYNDVADDLIGYFNGSQVGIDANVAGWGWGAQATGEVGFGSARNEEEYPLDGKVDEFRFSNITRSASYLRQVFNNSKGVDGYCTLGPLEVGNNAPTLINCSVNATAATALTNSSLGFYGAFKDAENDTGMIEYFVYNHTTLKYWGNITQVLNGTNTLLFSLNGTDHFSKLENWTWNISGYDGEAWTHSHSYNSTSINISNSIPDRLVIASIDGQANDSITTNNTPGVLFEPITDPDGDNGSIELRFNDSTVNWSGSFDNGTAAHVAPNSTLSDGKYWVNAYLTDGSGTSTISANSTVTVNARPPNITSSSPLNDYNYSGSVLINATILEIATNISLVYVNISNSSGLVANWTLTNYTGTNYYNRTWDSTAYEDDNYTIRLGSNDSSGNFNWTEINITTDNTNPQLTPGLSSGNYSGGNISINASVIENFFIDVQEWKWCNQTGDANCSIWASLNGSLNLSQFVDNRTINISFRTNDTLGNNDSDTVYVTVDHDDPVVNNVSLETDAGYTDTAYDIYCNVSDSASSISEIRVMFTDPNNLWEGNYSLGLLKGNCSNSCLWKYSYTFTTASTVNYSNFTFFIFDGVIHEVQNLTNDLEFKASNRPAATTTISGGGAGGTISWSNAVTAAATDYLIHFVLVPATISPPELQDFLPGDNFRATLLLENKDDLVTLDLGQPEINCSNFTLCTRDICTVSNMDSVILEKNQKAEIRVDCTAPPGAVEGDVYLGELRVVGCDVNDADVCDERAARMILPIQKARYWAILGGLGGWLQGAFNRIINFNIIESFKNNPLAYVVGIIGVILLIVLVAAASSAKASNTKKAVEKLG